MPRRDLTLAEKIGYLDQIKQQPPHTTLRRLAEITGLTKSTTMRLVQQENTLREEWAQCEGGRGTFKKRKREGKDPDVEKALTEWFAIVSEQGMRVSGPTLKCTAEELAKNLGRVDFKATDGWLSRWKSRHDIRFRKSQGEKESAADVAGEWKTSKVPELLEKFPADDIYNADETWLYYRTTPDDALLSGPKKAMDRVTVLCCSNMSGTDRKKLLVVGKTAKPHCFKGLGMDGLPVAYRANSNACMTSELFKEWLEDWDGELQSESRKVLLLLDNCAEHPRVERLTNIQLEFLPPRITAMVQPMVMGIITNLKTLYFARLVNFVLGTTEGSLPSSSSAATDVGQKINIFQALTFMADSWRNVTSETIRDSFSRCGFKHVDLEMDVDVRIKSETEDVTVELYQFENYADLVSINNEIDENGEYKVAIGDPLEKKHTLAPANQKSDQSVTIQDARKSIETLRRYFLQEGNEGSPIAQLEVCSDFVQKKSVYRTGSLDGLFKR